MTETKDRLVELYESLAEFDTSQTAPPSVAHLQRAPRAS